MKTTVFGDIVTACYCDVDGHKQYRLLLSLVSEFWKNVNDDGDDFGDDSVDNDDDDVTSRRQGTETAPDNPSSATRALYKFLEINYKISFV